MPHLRRQWKRITRKTAEMRADSGFSEKVAIFKIHCLKFLNFGIKYYTMFLFLLLYKAESCELIFMLGALDLVFAADRCRVLFFCRQCDSFGLGGEMLCI